MTEKEQHVTRRHAIPDIFKNVHQAFHLKLNLRIWAYNVKFTYSWRRNKLPSGNKHTAKDKVRHQSQTVFCLIEFRKKSHVVHVHCKHSSFAIFIEVVLSQFPPKCKTSNVFLTITSFFCDFIKYLGDVDIRLSLDWVKYFHISWSGKWRFFAYTAGCLLYTTLAFSDSEETVLDLRISTWMCFCAKSRQKVTRKCTYTVWNPNQSTQQ